METATPNKSVVEGVEQTSLVFVCVLVEGTRLFQGANNQLKGFEILLPILVRVFGGYPLHLEFNKFKADETESRKVIRGSKPYVQTQSSVDSRNNGRMSVNWQVLEDGGTRRGDSKRTP